MVDARMAGMTQSTPIRARRYRIVVGMDLSEYSDIVLEHALDQAARHDAPEIHLLTVQERRRPSKEEVYQALWARSYVPLEAFNRHARNWRARLHIRSGRPEAEIAELAADLRADLIVIGQFGIHNPKDAAKLPNAVLRAAVCPTLVVGLPTVHDPSPQCARCSWVREETEGERFFCAAHAADQVMSPMMVWTGGSMM
jgi:nucleotide-binding universal stress UspA family protein